MCDIDFRLWGWEVNVGLIESLLTVCSEEYTVYVRIEIVRGSGKLSIFRGSLLTDRSWGCTMPIFMMFGKYSKEALQHASPERTKKVIEIIKQNDGKVISMYAVAGEHDLVFTLDFPDTQRAITTSLAMKKLTGISFVTSPVVDVEQLDQLLLFEVKTL
jgi:uncharacterized protein with GYD domain